MCLNFVGDAAGGWGRGRGRDDAGVWRDHEKHEKGWVHNEGGRMARARTSIESGGIRQASAAIGKELINNANEGACGGKGL